MGKRSRKAKIKRKQKRREKLKKRSLEMVGLINRGGAGIHAGQDASQRREAKAPQASEWTEQD